MAFEALGSALGQIVAAAKANQSTTRVSVVPVEPPRPKTIAERCREEAIRLTVTDGGSIERAATIATEKACIEKARNFGYFVFFMNVLAVAAKLDGSPALKAPIKNKFEKFSDDLLTVRQPRIVNREFVAEPNTGISVFRPEILSILNFQPVYSGDPKNGDFTSEGQMIEAQWQAGKVREQSLSELQQSMQSRGATGQEEADKIYQAMQDNFQRIVDETDQLTDIFGKSIERIDLVTALFDVKKMWANRSPELSLLDLKAFFQQHMGFSETQFNTFSNTKILIQLMSDFRQVLENYSFNLLDVTDPDRPGDFSPINIDTSVSLGDGFSFTSAMLRSGNVPLNATDRKVSDAFLKSLPSDPGDRIKVLINFLSKEYRISAALGSDRGNLPQKLQQKWGSGTEGSPFDNIIGVAGKTIFDAPTVTPGSDSLINLLYENVSLPGQPGSVPGEATVFPFEDKYVDSEDKDFVPGSSFFVDRMYDLETDNNGNPIFNQGPLKEYIDRYVTRFLEAKEVIMQLFLLGQGGQPVQFDIQPQIMYDRFADALKDSTKGIDTNTEFPDRGRDSIQAFSVAMFALANDDRKLKNLLFQYLIIMGILSNVDNNPGVVWADVARELGEVTNLNVIKLPKGYSGETSLLEGPKVLAPLLEGVVGQIHRQVRATILKGLQGTSKERKKARKNPALVRQAVSKFKKEGFRAFVNRGIPVAIGVNTDFIENALLQIAKDTTHVKDPNLFREFVDIASKLTDGIGGQGFQEYLLGDNSGRTRFNFVSTSHQLLVMFEIMTAMTAKFSFSRFRRDPNENEIVIDTNTRLVEFMNTNIKNMAGTQFDREETTLGGFDKAVKARVGTDDPKKFATDYTQEHKLKPLPGDLSALGGVSFKLGRPKNQGLVDPKARNATERNLVTSLNDIKSKLDSENNIIVNFLWILQKVGQDLLQAKSYAEDFFTPQLLELALQAGSIEDLRIMKDPAQVTLTAFLNNELNVRARTAFVNADIILDGATAKRNPIVTNTISEAAKEALYTYLQEPEFQRESATVTKVFSVGVPAQFVRNTQDRINKQTIVQNSFKQKEADVITVNVHKRDLRRPELIFKPQKFTFDMSLFQRERDIIEVAPQPGESHETLLARNQVRDFTKPASIKSYTLNGSNSILKDQKYDFLTDNERIDIIENHYQSFLLETYIKMATGMAINEKRFTIDATPPSQIMDIGFEALLLSYIKDIQGQNIPNGQNIQELLDNPAVAETVKDTIRSMSSGQAMATPMTERDRILKPKKFDRVFHVPVNLDDFEIDVEAMESTVVGKQALRKAALQNQFRTKRSFKTDDSRPVFLKQRTDRDIIFEDFFVTLESTNDEDN